MGDSMIPLLLDQRKLELQAWTREQKLQKLAAFSHCSGSKSCKCEGWKSESAAEADWGEGFVLHFMRFVLILFNAKLDHG